MSKRCIGCDIAVDGELTPFGETLSEYGGSQAEPSRGLFAGANRGRSDTDDIQRAKETYEELNLPEGGCPHQPYNGTDRCIFHLSEAERQDRGVTTAELRDAFIRAVNEGGFERQNDKVFINATVPKLDLRYLELNAENNRPIDLRFSTVGDVRFDQTVLHETLKLDHSVVESLQWHDSELFGGVTARETEVEDTAIELKGNHIENVFDLSGSVLRAKAFEIEDNHFVGDMILEGATIELKSPDELVSADETNVSFNDNRFSQRLDCTGVVLRSDPNESSATSHPSVGNIRVTMRRCEFDGKVSFKRAEIGTWNERRTRMGGVKQQAFEDEISEVSLKGGDFSGVAVEFGSMDVAGEFDISDGNFDRADVDMSGLRTEGELDLSATNYSEKDVYMKDININGDCTFEDATFQNNRFSFEDATIDADAKFDDVILDGSAIEFHDVLVGGAFEMADSKVTGKDIDFSDFKTRGTISLDRATVSGQNVDFSGLKAGSLASVRSANIECETVQFDNSTFEGGVTFENARFDTNEVTFEDATFEGKACFSQVRFNGIVKFSNASFDGVGAETIDFSDIDAKDARLLFLSTGVGQDKDQTETREQSTVINFSGSVILSGRFRQPATPGTYYDFSEATVGDIDLMFHPDRENGEGQLFNYFRFYETEFDGFDFSNSRYRKELKENDWRLDTVALTPGAGSEQADGQSATRRNGDAGAFSHIATTVGRYWRLVTRGSSPESEYDRLESTYRKAKISADENGDSEASSKFFQKELLFRRRTHGHRVWLRAGDGSGTGVNVWERSKRAWLWLTNWVLWVTSGYGERPKRVILSSIAVIILFTGLYELAWFASGFQRPAQLEGAAGSLILSAEMFTAIILGGSDVTATPIQILSYIQGFVGSFFIALFVLTITRSVRR